MLREIEKNVWVNRTMLREIKKTFWGIEQCLEK